MIGTKFLKTDIVGESVNDDVVAQYAEAAEWCNQNGAMIADDGEYFVVEAVPEPEPPTVEEKIKALTDAIQKFMDDKVHSERGYDDVFTAISYINSTNRRFATEARQVLEWRDAIWTLSNSLLAQFKAGAIPEMTAEEVIAKFPELNWLTEDIDG